MHPYDAHAVAVYLKKTKIGYIPRVNNKEVSKLLEVGMAKTNRISPEEDPGNQIGIVVFLKMNTKK
ncbi:MAG: HIRAN domain-containing protein [Candidatus Absconditicoccaceae bacterium]